MTMVPANGYPCVQPSCPMRWHHQGNPCPYDTMTDMANSSGLTVPTLPPTDEDVDNTELLQDRLLDVMIREEAVQKDLDAVRARMRLARRDRDVVEALILIGDIERSGCTNENMAQLWDLYGNHLFAYCEGRHSDAETRALNTPELEEACRFIEPHYDNIVTISKSVLDPAYINTGKDDEDIIGCHSGTHYLNVSSVQDAEAEVRSLLDDVVDQWNSYPGEKHKWTSIAGFNMSPNTYIIAVHPNDYRAGHIGPDTQVSVIVDNSSVYSSEDLTTLTV